MQDGSRCLGRVASWWSPFLHVSLYPMLALALPGTQTRFSQEPADQTVVAGQRAVLPCVLLNYSGIVQWTKDGLALGMGQGLKGEWGCPASPTSRLPRLCTHTSPYPSPDRFLDSVLHLGAEARCRRGAGEGAGSSLIAVFPSFSLPGEFSREKPEEDGRDLFFALRQWRRQWRRLRRRRRQGSCCRGDLSSSSPQRARVLSCLGESRLFLREMRLFWARGLSGTSCCERGSWPPL